MDFNDYKEAFRRIDKMSVITKVSLGLGCVIMFMGIFFKFPTFIYFLAIGFSLVLFWAVYELVRLLKKKYGYRHIKRAKPVKEKTVRCKKIKGDKEHVLCECPHCDKKIRLPNKKGRHGVCCPNCRNDFRVKI